jgi:uncharacterized protein
MLRSIWRRYFKLNKNFGIFLVLLFGIPRFIIVLNANVTRNYKPVSIIFLCMCIAPFVLLTKEGRREIGIKKPVNKMWLMYSLLIGVSVCMLMYAVAEILFANSMSNWFVYISKSYATSAFHFNDSNRLTYFLIYAIASMTFSPIGEELFYRGIVHASFASAKSENMASVWDSVAFALTHLAHFGIVFIGGKWKFILIPAVLWVVGMFFASRLFFLSKQKTKSILGAIICHAGFNVTMIYFIFYHIL